MKQMGQLGLGRALTTASTPALLEGIAGEWFSRYPRAALRFGQSDISPTGWLVWLCSVPNLISCQGSVQQGPL